MDVLLNGRPSFLIDTATREGMSGSPVVHVDRSAALEFSGVVKPGRTIRFVGVYSGRHIGKKEIEAQLGVVWRQEVINDILVARQLGLRVSPPARSLASGESARIRHSKEILSSRRLSAFLHTMQDQPPAHMHNESFDVSVRVAVFE